MRSLYLTMLLGLNAGAAAADNVTQADLTRILPPPGLYRVEDDATMTHLSNGMSVRDQSNQSGTLATYHSPDGHTAQQQINHPQATICVPLRKANAPLLPIAMGTAACKTLSTTVSGDTLSHEAQCAIGRTAFTITRLGNDQWEYTDDNEWGAGGMARNNPAAMRPMVEQMARNAPTEADRTKARQLLAQLPQLQAQSDQQMVAALAGARQALKEARTPEEVAAMRKVVQMLENQDSLPAQNKSSGKSRWTRIADSCGAAVKK